MKEKHALREKQVGIDAAISLLDCFSLENAKLAMTDISKISGYHKATTSRYLKSLQRAGLVKRDPVTKEYSLGYKIYWLYHIASSSTSLQKTALAYMQRLKNSINETVYLTVANGNQGICIERVVNYSDIMHMPEIGVEKPLHAGASRKVLLAFMPQERIKEILDQGLKKVTEKTITDPDLLQKDLRDIRETGYSVSIGENSMDVKAIAVPIHYNSSVMGSLSISGPVFRMPKDRDQGIIGELKKAAQGISMEMGSISPDL